MPLHKRGTTEDMHYADRGCVDKAGPRSCLACPRALCILDEPAKSDLNAEHAKPRL